MASERLFLIDGSALVYRSYYAFQRNPLITAKGEPTSVVFGFAAAIMRLVNKENPTRMAVLFDTGKPTFRKEIYADYKATRKPMPDDMREQLPRLDEMLATMKLPTTSKVGFEADDLMGTIATEVSKHSVNVVLVTGDKKPVVISWNSELKIATRGDHDLDVRGQYRNRVIGFNNAGDPTPHNAYLAVTYAGVLIYETLWKPRDRSAAFMANKDVLWFRDVSLVKK